MKEPEAVDLSLLDPERDPRRWSVLMDATRLRVAEAVLRRSRELDPLALVSAWARPILAAAAVILLLLGAATVFGKLGTRGMSKARGLAHLTESSVLRGQAPTGAELMAVIRLGEAR
ncbi:MAG: hypothetical protein ACREMX_02625 [Gemmatimonadales bacterium]